MTLLYQNILGSVQVSFHLFTLFEIFLHSGQFSIALRKTTSHSFVYHFIPLQKALALEEYVLIEYCHLVFPIPAPRAYYSLLKVEQAQLIHPSGYAGHQFSLNTFSDSFLMRLTMVYFWYWQSQIYVFQSWGLQTSPMGNVQFEIIYMTFTHGKIFVFI